MTGRETGGPTRPVVGRPAGLRRGWLVAGVVTAAVLAGCGAAPAPSPTPSTPAPSPAPSSAAPGATPSASAATPGPSASAASSPATPDPSTSLAAARLAGVLELLDQGYKFESTIVVGSATATRATGHWVGGTSEFDVTASGATVTYRSVPPNAWVRQGGQPWAKLDGAAPGGDPLGVLGSPESIKVDGEDAAGMHLTGKYPAAGLGAAVAGTVDVSMLIGPDGSLTVSFKTAFAGAGGGADQVGTASTRLEPASGLVPFTAP